MKLKIWLIRIGVSLLAALPAPLIIAGVISQLPGIKALTLADLLDSSLSGAEVSVFIATIIVTAVLVLIGQFILLALGDYLEEDDREEGLVKWFNVSKGFGFLTREDGEDVFVHFRSIRGRGHRSLQEGQRVLFGVVESSKGLQAEDVTVLRSK